MPAGHRPTAATTPVPRRRLLALLRGIGAGLLVLVGLLATAWGALALWYQAPGAEWLVIALVAAWSLLGLVACVAIALRARAWRHRSDRAPLRWTLPACALAWLVLLVWWQTLQPSHQRDWADDVARLLAPEVVGNRLTLHNVRDFDWRSETDYDARWETREYDLDRLVSADLVLSYWMGPAIAHTLVSFGFDDGRQLVFSLEIRKERQESFSAIAGFFKQYETVLVAADERDIVRVRSNVRGEDVYLYRLTATPAQLRAMLLGYLDRADELRRTPRFYNTLTSNCTTIVFELARRISPGLPLDYRLLLSGYLGEYVHDLGALAPGYDFPALQAAGRITDRAKAADASGEDFTQAIRRGVPGMAGAPSGSPAGGAPSRHAPTARAPSDLGNSP
ncbi:Lnb N-terminal periplasmic domain-containing protein [Luteimonas sp. RIT-PG2_3]